MDDDEAGSFTDFERSLVCFDWRNFGSFDEGDDAEGACLGLEDIVVWSAVVVACVAGVDGGGGRGC